MSCTPKDYVLLTQVPQWTYVIGARDLHSQDKQRKTSEPIHFCIANGTTEADTTAQYYSSALGEEVSPHVLTDSVPALNIGKGVANGCEFHWTLERITNLVRVH